MNNQAKILAALVVEDMESDAQLLVRMLKKAGYELVHEQVETAAQMRAALEKRSWDIVIADYSLPQFSGEGALEILRKTGLDIPFIVVSGTMGEETAVAMMKAGAQDYLMKNDLARLIPAVARELEQAEIRRERKKAQEQLLLQGSALNAAANAIVITDREGTIEWANPAFTVLTGYTFEEAIRRNPRDLLKSGKHDLSLYQHLWETILAGEVWHGELINRRKDGSFYTEEQTITPLKSTDGTISRFIAIKQDVTARKQAERALAASEAELRALFASMRDVVLVIDRQGLYRKIAPTNQDLLVRPGAELLGKKLRNVFPTEQADFFVSTIQQVLDSGQTALIEYKLLIGNQTIWFETFISPMDDDSTLWVARDITERKQTEEALRESERRERDRATELQTIMDTVPAAVTIAHDQNCHVTTGNRALYKLLHMPLQSNTSLTALAGQRPTHFKIYMDGVELSPNELPLQTSAATGVEIHDIEEDIVFEDGMVVHLFGNVVPLFNEQGQPRGAIAAFVDITERVLAEEALAASEAELRALVEQVPAIVYTESAEDRETIYISKQLEKMTGYTAHEWMQDRDFWKKIIHPEDLEAVVEADRHTSATREPFLTEYRIVTRGGGVIWIRDEAVLIQSQDGVPLFWQGVMYEITQRKRAEEDIRQRVSQLEMLYESGLALGQLLNPKGIGEKIIELLEEKLGWHHTSICLYNAQDNRLKLLDFNQPGLKDEADKRAVEEHFNKIIASSRDGLTGWAFSNSYVIRSDDVTGDPHYIETYPGIRSGLYVPMQMGSRKIGVIGIESQQPNAFSEADEQLIVTLANQAASALENARLFEETHNRVMELETLNRISLVLRSISKQNEMLSIVLDEALAILDTSHGSIVLHNKTTGNLERTIARGWNAQVTEEPHAASEGIAGKVFTSGEIYISREFTSDLETRAVSRSQMPSGWGGACLPIRTSQRTLGVMIVSVPSERELDKDKIRLLSILSEMTGAALQRMQLHEQTVHRLEQLNALRAVDQAISSSRDMHLTFNILLTHTISQLNVDAADVLLFYPGSNTLELVAGQGFHTLLAESASLSDSFAGRLIAEHRSIMALDFEAAKQNPQFGKLWKEEGFVYYWCVPLIVKGEVKGVLEVYCRNAFTPDAEWIEFFEALAGQAAIAIDNTQLFENLQRANMDLGLAYDATIEGWSRAMDMRDHETEGHTLRVTDLTLKLARAMRVSESQLIAIRRGALLHDIGKMGVPDAILLKEGKLTDEEWAIMRQHPQFARDMLLPIAYLNDALNIPYCHHEKWDGTGYPQGLKGDHIPIAARIFAVVDVWDALTNDRTYRKKWSKQKALQYIREQSGRYFDPQVVDTFLKNIGKIS